MKLGIYIVTLYVNCKCIWTELSYPRLDFFGNSQFGLLSFFLFLFSAGGVVASILVVLCLFWVGLVDQVGFQSEGTVLNLTNLPVAIGLYGYCYSGHAVFPNIYTSMAKPSQYPSVLLIRYLKMMNYLTYNWVFFFVFLFVTRPQYQGMCLIFYLLLCLKIQDVPRPFITCKFALPNASLVLLILNQSYQDLPLFLHHMLYISQERAIN